MAKQTHSLRNNKKTENLVKITLISKIFNIDITL